MAQELDIDLDNYDITEEAYEALMEAAASKFGNCHQYRLYALSPKLYSCYTCHSKPRIWLQGGQTFRIGQTCNGQKARYGASLPEPGLKYFIEFEGSIFDVLVAEYVKLILFRSSKERDAKSGLLFEDGKLVDISLANCYTLEDMITELIRLMGEYAVPKLSDETI